MTISIVEVILLLQSTCADAGLDKEVEMDSAIVFRFAQLCSVDKSQKHQPVKLARYSLPQCASALLGDAMREA